eukprot:6172804-Pleurochrysis_carterae.AAC.1
MLNTYVCELSLKVVTTYTIPWELRDATEAEEQQQRNRYDAILKATQDCKLSSSNFNRPPRPAPLRVAPPALRLPHWPVSASSPCLSDVPEAPESLESCPGSECAFPSSPSGILFIPTALNSAAAPTSDLEELASAGIWPERMKLTAITARANVRRSFAKMVLGAREDSPAGLSGACEASTSRARRTSCRNGTLRARSFP